MNSHDILIVGAGGLAKQCLTLIKEKYKNPAFFDEFDKENDYFYCYPLYHSEEIVRVCDTCIILISDSKKRKILTDRFRNKKIHINSLISPDFINKIQDYDFRWQGIILKDSLVEDGVKLSSGCLINTRCSIHHGSYIGKYVTLAPNVVILGDCNIGDFTQIGAGTVIREKTKIGSNCLIGQMSNVVCDIPDNQIWFGNPAKFVRNNE